MENKVLPTQHLATAWLRPCLVPHVVTVVRVSKHDTGMEKN